MLRRRLRLLAPAAAAAPWVPALGLALGGLGACATGDTGPGEHPGSGSGGAGGSGGALTGGQGGLSGGGSGDQGGASACPADCSSIVTDQCQVAGCDEASGTCYVEPAADGTACDDGLFCTAFDSCVAGICTGGPTNDCGLPSPECQQITCDESSQSCAVAPLPDGFFCALPDPCLVNVACSGGVCTGAPKDCTFAPVPNDCHVAVCHPATGDCEPTVGNEGLPCVDQSDLCSDGNTCANGVCSGGAPKDCSHLDQGCFYGTCDPLTGQCTTAGVPPGSPCPEGDGQCTAGECDAGGSCLAVPANQGGACNDFNPCTAGEICDSSGTCSGGGPVTACLDGDSCCPSGCDGSNDSDCLCGVTKLRFSELHIGPIDYVQLYNPTACPLDLGGLQILFDDSDSGYTDLITVLPTFTLAAGAGVYIIESGAVAGEIDAGGNITFAPSRGGAAILCNGPCSPTDGSNVIDVVAFSTGEPFPPLPAGISFIPAGLTGIDSGNQTTTSFLRQAYIGTAPSFVASDWTTGPASE